MSRNDFLTDNYLRMKRVFLFVILGLVTVSLSSCGGGTGRQAADDDGWIVLFNGKNFDGWRGYNMDRMPEAWIIENGAIRIQGSGRGEAGAENGGDIIFDRKFKDFELELEWRVGPGSNSGIFYLAQEIPGEPIFISSPEYQVLDNGRAGIGANRQSASLYDMIPAEPQNAKPQGEWNKAGITVYRGTVIHFQNDVAVVEYRVWTPEWTEMLQDSKFSEEEWPLAFELLNNVGGENREGYIGLQDHGDDVWFRNIRIREL